MADMTSQPKIPMVPLRALRDAKGWSVHQLRDRMEEQGYVLKHPGSIRNVETGNRRPSKLMKHAMALALGIDPVDIVLPPNGNGNGDEDAA
jgi:transcriptional regulator with XRE-family HTH domain